MNEIIKCCRVEIDDSLIESAKSDLKSIDAQLNSKANIFSLLGNEVRLRIVYLFLRYERMCVCDLSDVLQMNQSPISQHLRKLKDGGILDKKREGMTIYYFIKEDVKPQIETIIRG